MLTFKGNYDEISQNEMSVKRMTLEAGKEMERKCVLDWLNKVYIAPSLSYSEYTDEEIRIFAHDALVMLNEQKKLIDVDELREKLGLAKDCAKCKQNARECQYGSHFSLMDFCERLDMAIDELTK